MSEPSGHHDGDHDIQADHDIEANRALVLEMVDRIVNKGEWDAAADLFAPDFVAHGAGGGAGDVESMRHLIGAWRRGFPDWCDEILDVIAERDLVTLRIRATGTHLGRIAGIEPTGRPVQWGMIEIIRVRDGRIAEQWGYSDFGDVLASLRTTAATTEG